MRPIYSTKGNWEAMLVDGLFYDTSGEWIGWLDGVDVYSQYGEYVGYMSPDGRILRKRLPEPHPFRSPPPSPGRMRPLAKVPLAPTFGELPWNLVDVFEEDPGIFYRLHSKREAEDS
jgi:hypothetical protein